MRPPHRSSWPAVALALAASLLAACGKGAVGTHRTIDYYHSHATEWEHQVWVCTNDVAPIERTPACATALEALPKGAARRDAGVAVGSAAVTAR